MTDIVYKSAVASLWVQIIIAGVTFAGFFIDVADKRQDLQTIFAFEFSSQVVEFAWYLYVVCRDREIRTWTRYIDWVISTPVMLISTALFFYHRRDLPLGDVATTWPIYASVGFDWLMLLFGFLMETDVVSRGVGLSLGGWAYVGVFTTLAVLIDDDDTLSVVLFALMYVVWGLYGIAAALPYREKNVAYNALDVVSKNFYGVFLFGYAIYSSSSSSSS